MKAKQYFEQFLNENKEHTTGWRMVNAFRGMLLEVEEIRKQRNARTNSAMIAIFNEIEKKSHAFINMVNEIEPFKSEGKIKRNAFEIFTRDVDPELGEMICGKTNE